LVTYLVSKRSRCRRQRLRYCRKSGVGHVSAPMVFKRRKTGARHLLGHQLRSKLPNPKPQHENNVSYSRRVLPAAIRGLCNPVRIRPARRTCLASNSESDQRPLRRPTSEAYSNAKTSDDSGTSPHRSATAIPRWSMGLIWSWSRHRPQLGC